MKLRGLYKHVNNTDVAAEVVKCFYVRERRLLKVKLRWWNVCRYPPWDMGIEQRFEIPVDVWLAEWKPLDMSPRPVPG